jgi:hypothetical protein
LFYLYLSVSEILKRGVFSTLSLALGTFAYHHITQPGRAPFTGLRARFIKGGKKEKKA